MYIQLQEKVTGLENIVKEQNKRLSALESDKTKVSLNNIGAPLTGSMDQAEGGKLGQPKRADPGTQVNPPQPGAIHSIYKLINLLEPVTMPRMEPLSKPKMQIPG